MRLRIPTILLYLPILIHADYPTLFGPPTESSDSSISSPTDGDYSTEPLTSGYPTRAASTSAATSVAQYLTEATLSESTEDITRTFDLETEFLFPGAQRMKDILYHDESYNVRWRPPSSRGPDSANGENEPATRFYGLGLAPIGSDTATTELEPLYEFFLYNNGSYWWTVDDTFRPGRWEMVMVDGHGGWAGPNARILALSGPFEIRESRAGSGTVEDSGENDSGVDETIEGVDGTEDDEEGAMREELERMKQEARKKEEDRQEEEQHKEQEKTQAAMLQNTGVNRAELAGGLAGGFAAILLLLAVFAWRRNWFRSTPKYEDSPELKAELGTHEAKPALRLNGVMTMHELPAFEDTSSEDLGDLEKEGKREKDEEIITGSVGRRSQSI